MANKVSNNDIQNMNQDWGLDVSNNLPYSGAAVQKFIKETLNSKMGYFYYDVSSNRYLVFADENAKDQYLNNPNITDLVLGTFDAPFNYEASITLLSSNYVSIPVGTTGNTIEFTFDTTNKNGDSVGEDVTCTYTITRGSTKKTVTQKYRAGQIVKFNVDDYLIEGTNRITIGIVGQTTLAATTVGVTYQVINLSLSDDTDISKVYDLSQGAQVMEVPFSVAGTGVKTVEWYLNGTQLEFDKNVDEVVESASSRVKYIPLNTVSRGANVLEFRAYSTVDGERFYSKVLHRDIIVENTALQNQTPIIATAYEKDTLDDTGIKIQQYVAYDLRFAINNPQNPVSTPVDIYIDGNKVSTVNTENGVENIYSIISSETGSKSVKLVAVDAECVLSANVSETTINIQEINAGLELGFSAIGKTNSTSGKEFWSGNGYTGTLSGFNYVSTSGWVNNRLLMAAGNKIDFDYAPLASESTETGKTIEFEFSSSNVSDDNAVLCDLRNSNGVGILITASEAKITSRGGVNLYVKYKPEQNTRISFVINRATGVTNKGLVFIYVDGVISAATNFGISDDFKSDKTLSFAGSDKSEVSLKQIRAYGTALNGDQILNNYILYRDTTSEMLKVYDRNDIYEEGSLDFSIDKLQGQLPVMLVTGDIPILEDTTNKDTQITVDIEYYNLQDPKKSFTMTSAAMRPQGTSSMLYPKKNYRIYTQKLENTKVYDYNGNEIANKLYAFKDGSQPVNCWCLKADYAESSGTHNTGIARLWNEVLYNSVINGEHVFRTNAQKAAIENKYQYDVRTTVDGFPILLFYRRSAEENPIFIGKYNFNNDKSTESVFGFTGIPGFNDERMQCWEILNNGDALALFTDVSDFDTRWADAFESRYPDTKTPNTADLKAFSIWLNSMNGKAEQFATEKWDHMNVYLMAAYYVYLMRFGAVDQTVKNAMLTSEDGEHFYFINYDNDTINGLRNNGVLVFDPTIDRQSLDPETGGLAYAYAGHDSVLWNMLEGDEEFMQLVKDVDNALYATGLSYDRVIEVFNDQQADKWNERVYNQDAQYKYIGPYTNSSLNNLEMLQGKRQSHRMWWLSRRFSLYDAKFVSGDFKGKALEFKVINNTEPGWTFSIEAGADMEYGYGVYNPKETGVTLRKDQTHSFTIDQTLNIGDPVRIYSAVNLQGVDLSNILPRLSNVELNNVWNEAMGTKLKKLVLGNGTSENTVLSSVSSIAKAKRLEYLDIRGCKGITTLDLSQNFYMKTLKAIGSGLTSVEFANGAPIAQISLPNTIQNLRLEQLIYITPSGLQIEDDYKNVVSYHIIGCPQLSNNISLPLQWINNKVTSDVDCSLYIDNVNWTNVEPGDLLKICDAKVNGMDITLKGKIKLTTSSQEIIDKITSAFGSLVFKPTNDLYINAPDAIYLAGPDEILEGESAQFTAAVFTENYGTVTYAISSGSRTGVTINTQTGYLTSIENGNSDSTLTIRAMHRPTSGSSVYVDKTLKIKKRIYPQPTINGSNRLANETESYTWVSSTSGVTGDFYAEWELTGDILEYANIEFQNTDKCIIRRNNTSIEEVTGTLTLYIKRKVDNFVAYSTTKTLAVLNPDIIMTSTTNPEVLSILYSKGLCANETYITRAEVEAITDVDILPTNNYNGSIFYRSGIKHFDEFEYFIGLSGTGYYWFYDCTALKSFKTPTTWTNVSLHIPENTTSYTIGDQVEQLNVTIVGANTPVIIPPSLKRLSIDAQRINFEELTLQSNASELRIDRLYFNHVKKLIVNSNIAFNQYDGYYSYSGLEELIIKGTPKYYGFKDKEVPFRVIDVVSSNSYSTIKRITFEVPQISTGLFDWNNGAPNLSSLEEVIFAKNEMAYTFSDNVVRLNGNLHAVLTKYSGAFENLLSGNESEYEVSWYIYQPNYTSIDIPSRFERFSDNMAENVYKYPNLEYFNIAGTGTYQVLENGLIVSTQNKTVVGCAPKERRMTDILTLTSEYSTIRINAFRNCQVIKSIIIEGSMKMNSGFQYSSIENIVIKAAPNGKLPSFDYLGNLKKLDISLADGVELSVLLNYSACEELLLPSSLTSIPKGSFVGFKGTKIPKITGGNITSWDSFFTDSQNLIEAEIPEGITQIGYSFNNCPSLKSVIFPSSLTDTGSFANSSLEEIVFPQNITNICSSVCDNCKNLRRVVFLSNNISQIPSYAFSGCLNLSSISIACLTAPSVSSSAFGSSRKYYTGRNTYDTGENMLYIPQGATGYDTSYWLDPLCNSSKCGFTLSATL